MALNFNKSWTPKAANTVNIAPTTTSANVDTGAIIAADSVVRGNVRIYNGTNATVFIKFGNDNTVVATAAAGIPIASGEVEVMGLRSDSKWVAAILASGTATGAIYFSPGEGI